MNHTRKFSSHTILGWMINRTNKVPCSVIAEYHGTTAAYVRAATGRVVREDAKMHDDMIVFPKPDKKVWCDKMTT